MVVRWDIYAHSGFDARVFLKGKVIDNIMLNVTKVPEETNSHIYT